MGSSAPAIPIPIILIARAKRGPVTTWFSLLERPLYQADRLVDMTLRADGRMTLIRNKGDLVRCLEPGLSVP